MGARTGVGIPRPVSGSRADGTGAATATLADTLPKDVVICDWQLSYGDMKAAWGTPTSRPGGESPTTMFDNEFAIPIHLVGHDMGVSDYLDTGILNYRIPPSWFVDNG